MAVREVDLVGTVETRPAEPQAADSPALDDQLAGLDALERSDQPEAGRAARTWTLVWPKVAAVVLLFGFWEAVVLSGWKPDYVLPGPVPVLKALGDRFSDGTMPHAVATTMRRAAVGYTFAVVIGTGLGLVVSQVKLLRAAFGSLISGLLTMPSIAWLPLSVVLFKLSEGAMFFVVVMGAAPAVANGIISGIDHIPPQLLRAGRVLGARGLSSYRHVIFPAALPGYVAVLKQGWAFAWRSLMAGELIVQIAGRPSIGRVLDNDRQYSDAEGLLGTMLVILVIGILLDAQVFGRLDRAVRQRFGLEAD